ncbi:hypothetical protein NEIPOLOT_00254 [Neisseria polysaccharea ATCC 43768]|nr:hypothetical protein NEIPOLOT_00254 [Neisseria polysaccharea ATCC 43768]
MGSVGHQSVNSGSHTSCRLKRVGRLQTASTVQTARHKLTV